MNEYEIHYISIEDENVIFVGSGVGKTEAEAVADFKLWHGSESKAIVEVQLFRTNIKAEGFCF